MNDLLEWASQAGITVHENLDFTQRGDYGTMGVATGLIPAGTHLCSIPFSACLTARVACEALHLDFARICQSNLESSVLAALLIRERSDPGSRWFAYLSALPETFGTPLYWNAEDLAWLKGTNLEGEQDVRRSWMLEKLQSLRQLYPGSIIPDNDDDNGIFSKEAWTWAMSVLNSRAFPSSLIDKTGESHPMLLPLLDTLNHRSPLAITWQSSHDDAAHDGSGTLTFINGTPYRPGEQVFNNYGTKSNEELLMSYGFCIEDDLHHVLTLKLPGSTKRHQIHSDNLLPSSLLAEVEQLLIQDRLQQGRPAPLTQFQHLHLLHSTILRAMQAKRTQLSRYHRDSHQTTTTTTPSTQNQVNAQIYRLGQLKVAEACTSFLESEVAHRFTHPGSASLLSLTTTLAGDFGDAIAQWLGTSDLEELIDAGLQEPALALLLCHEKMLLEEGKLSEFSDEDEEMEYITDIWQQLQGNKESIPTIFRRLDQETFRTSMTLVMQHAVERKSILFLCHRC